MADLEYFNNHPRLRHLTQKQRDENCFILYRLWTGFKHYYTNVARMSCPMRKLINKCPCGDDPGLQKTSHDHSEYDEHGNLIELCQQCRNCEEVGSKVEDIPAKKDMPKVEAKKIDESKMEQIVKLR